MHVEIVNASLVRVERSALPDLYAVPPRVGQRWLVDKTRLAVDPLVQVEIDRALRSVRSSTAPPG